MRNEQDTSCTHVEAVDERGGWAEPGPDHAHVARECLQAGIDVKHRGRTVHRCRVELGSEQRRSVEDREVAARGVEVDEGLAGPGAIVEARYGHKDDRHCCMAWAGEGLKGLHRSVGEHAAVGAYGAEVRKRVDALEGAGGSGWQRAGAASATGAESRSPACGYKGGQHDRSQHDRGGDPYREASRPWG